VLQYPSKKETKSLPQDFYTLLKLELKISCVMLQHATKGCSTLQHNPFGQMPNGATAHRPAQTAFASPR